jgi:hypothetical protein
MERKSQSDEGAELLVGRGVFVLQKLVRRGAFNLLILFHGFLISVPQSSKIDENMRAQMALDWIAKEQQQPGVISCELAKANQEIERARLSGQELRFFKEKRDILLLASFQFETEIISFN